MYNEINWKVAERSSPINIRTSDLSYFTTAIMKNNLIICDDCGNTISKEAVACTKCGKPSKQVKYQKRDQTQKAGCLFIILGVVALLFVPLFGIVGVVFGILLIMLSFIF